MGGKRGAQQIANGPEKKAKTGSDQQTTFPSWFQEGRARYLTQDTFLKNGNCVVYWMARDHRAEDNWAMLLARHVAKQQEVPLAVCFNLTPPPHGDASATLRRYGWMVKGLKEVEGDLRAKNIPLYLLQGDAIKLVPDKVQALKASAVITDFSPLRQSLEPAKAVANTLEGKIPLIQVDAHNVVPCWVASPKLETGARTIRRKIHDRLGEYLKDYPQGGLEANPKAHSLDMPKNDWDKTLKALKIDTSVKELDWLSPGPRAGLDNLKSFIDKRLKIFGDRRNDPTTSALSDMSPYYNFGHVSVQRAMLDIKHSGKYNGSVQSYLEEGIVRRELSDNFCYFNPKYDSLDGAANWARESLLKHKSDKREWVYNLQEFADAKTHDDLWNAAQLQLVQDGKLHGFLRMYWAKKILEWSKTPEEALKYALALNDRFEIDGRDPNGVVGCAWSVMGVHDQGWGERTITGKIRYMSYDGCQRKFNVDAFIDKYPEARKNAEAAIKSGKNKGGGEKSHPVRAGPSK